MSILLKRGATQTEEVRGTTSCQKPTILVIGVSGQIGGFVSAPRKYPQVLNVREIHRTQTAKVLALQQQGVMPVLLAWTISNYLRRRPSRRRSCSFLVTRISLSQCGPAQGLRRDAQGKQASRTSVQPGRPSPNVSRSVAGAPRTGAATKSYRHSKAAGTLPVLHILQCPHQLRTRN